MCPLVGPGGLVSRILKEIHECMVRGPTRVSPEYKVIVEACLKAINEQIERGPPPIIVFDNNHQASDILIDSDCAEQINEKLTIFLNSEF